MNTNIVEHVDQKFRSGNTIPVDRAYLSADEWAQLKAEIVRLRGELALAAGWHDESIAPAEAKGDAFADWLAREMPPGTVISNPLWWAPRILRAIERDTPQPAGGKAAVWQAVDEGGEPQWHEASFAEDSSPFDRCRPLYTTPPAAPAQGGEAVADVEDVLRRALGIARKINNDDSGDEYLNLSADLLRLLEKALSPRIGLSIFRTTPPAAQVKPPHCPDCGAGALYECPACSSTNYPPREAAQVHLTADMQRALPRGDMDLSTFQDVKDALDRAQAPGQGADGKWLTLPERIAALATHPAAGDKVRECEELHATLADEIAANLAFREAGGARPDEDMPTFCARLISERDAVRKIIENWRHDAGIADGIARLDRNALRACADELEAALRPSAGEGKGVDRGN